VSNDNDDDDWFKITSTPQDSESEDLVPTLSVVPDASNHDEDEGDWFSAVGPTGSAAEDSAPPATDEVEQLNGERDWLAESPLAPDTDVVDNAEPDDWVGASAPTVPIQQMPAAQRAAVPADRPQRSWLRRHRSAVAVGGSALALVVVGALAFSALAGTASSEETTPITALVTTTSPTTTADATPVAEKPWCADRTDGAPITVDSADPGEAAIARFQFAYYVDRDGHRARAFVTPDARVASAEAINGGIAQIPVGTEHCVLAKRTADGVYAVDLFERRPDTTSEHYRQTITTTPDGALITAITKRED
jgi:hypothetical protein